MTFRVLVYALMASLVSTPVSAFAAGPAFQGSLAAPISAPRGVAATAAGDLFAVDAAGRLHRMTKRGERVGTVLSGVTSVAAGAGVVFASTVDRMVLQVDVTTGRVLRRFPLGGSESPVGIAYDGARGKLWVAYASGLIQARGLDGGRLADVPPGAGVARLTGLSIAADGSVLVLQDRTGNNAGTIRIHDGETGAFKKAVSAPVRIAGGMSVGSAGQIYVSDLFSGTVQVVGADGAASGSFGAYGAAPGQLLRPVGVAMLSNGDVVVANMDGNRLDRFGGGAALPTCPGDSDCDGLPDEWEIANGLDPNDPSNALSDRDGDGLNDAEEYAAGSNPRLRDTDGDGFSDAEELATGFNPNDPDDHKARVVVDGPRRTDPGFVRLTGAVRDPTGTRTACSIAWKQTAGAPVALKGATTSTPSFVARAAGTYEFEASGTCGGVAALASRFSLDVNNVAPRADAGRIVTVPVGGRVDLSGRFSSDANGDVLAFQWDQMAGPPAVGSTPDAELSATVSVPGYYVFRVGATDVGGVEGAAEVSVLALGDAPVPTAVVQSPVSAHEGETVALDASGSLRGAGATFVWQQTAGAPVTLEGATTEVATFVAAPGRYAFDVSLEEGGVRGPPARVDVYVAAAKSELPVARIGAPASAAVDAVVTLDGGASTGVGTLGYAWRQVSGPAAGLTRADRPAATAVLFDRGVYEFELVVKDDAGVSVPAKARIEARPRGGRIPVAVATAPAAAAVGEAVALDGRASTGALRYEWTQVQGPWVSVEQGSLAAFRPNVPGTYGFELQVDDGSARSAPVRVNVVVY